jgi:hypothetical protein
MPLCKLAMDALDESQPLVMPAKSLGGCEAQIAFKLF